MGTEARIYHGEIKPLDVSRSLLAEFNHGNLRAQQFGTGDQIVVQIASKDTPMSGGQTAMTVQIQKVADGISILLGEQSWFGIAASLGMTALSAWRNPFNLINRLDDLAQDMENLQLTETVWRVINDTVQTAGASFDLSERLRRIVCSYCRAANPVGEPTCVACGAPLGDVQPVTCKNCGFVVRSNETYCPNCGKKI